MAKEIKKVGSFPRMADELKKLYGLPPYNVPSNICWNDSYFGAALENIYGMTLAEMEKLTGIRRP